MPFWAILLAHMGHNYGYETLMTELPTYMKQVHHFSIKDVSFYCYSDLFNVYRSHNDVKAIIQKKEEFIF